MTINKQNENPLRKAGGFYDEVNLTLVIAKHACDGMHYFNSLVNEKRK
ncbi:hypothetical protein PAE4_30594 [Bacillus altitudinis]|nr:hypothetical protein PAE4_30594 [Bacillus altitudinis]